MQDSLSLNTGQIVKVYYPDGLCAEVEILTTLGQGGFNIAFLAKRCNDPSAESFVLKMYLSGKEKDNREASILAKLGAHRLPVVSILADKIKVEVYPGIFYQGHLECLAPGKKMSSQKPTTRQALHLALGFASLLKECAKQNIAYRDVKPSDHIFWEATLDGKVASMTVIDWNISEMPANESGLYHDIWNFCRTLPEFFTYQPLTNNRRIHPLEWARSWQQVVDPRVWPLLADLSVNHVGPLLPGMVDFLSIERITRYTIEQAWDCIIQALEQTLVLLDNEQHINWPGIESLSNNKMLNELLCSPGSDQVKNAEQDLIFRWNKRSSIYLLSQTVDREVEEHLRLAHMIKPDNVRVGLTLAIYEAVVRTGVYREGYDAFTQILRNLVNNEKPEIFYTGQACMQLANIAHQAAERRQWPDIAAINEQVWRQLDSELQVWVLCRKVSDEPTLERKLQLAVELQKWATHPLATDTNKQVKDENIVVELTKQLAQAYKEGRLVDAQAKMESLGAYSLELVNKYVKVGGIKEVLDASQQIETLEHSWDPILIQQTIDNTARLELPERVKEMRARLIEKSLWLDQVNALYFRVGNISFVDTDAIIKLWMDILQFRKTTSQEFPQLTKLTQAWDEKFASEFAGLRQQTEILLQDEKLLKNTAQTAKLIENINEFRRVCNNCGKENYTPESERLLVSIEQRLDNLAEQARQKKEKLQSTIQSMMDTATKPSEYLTILDMLGTAEASIDFADPEIQSWITVETEKAQKLFEVTSVLENYQEKESTQQHQVQIFHDALKLLGSTEAGKLLRNQILNWERRETFEGQVLEGINTSKEQIQAILPVVQENNIQAQSLSDKLAAIPVDLSNEIISLKKTVEEQFDEIDRNVENLEKTVENLSIPSGLDPDTHLLFDNLTKTVEDHSRQLKRIDKRVISKREMYILLGAVILLLGLNLAGVLLLLNKANTVIPLDPTLTPMVMNTPDEPTVVTEPTKEPTNVPAPTPTKLEITPSVDPGSNQSGGQLSNSTATPTSQVTTIAELMPGAIFYADDLKTTLWRLNPSLTEAVSATLLEKDASGSFQKVQVEIVLGDAVIDKTNNKVSNTGVNIRVFKGNTEEPPVVGRPEKVFSFTPIPDPEGTFKDGAWHRVVFTGWIKVTDFIVSTEGTATAAPNQ